jgi:Tfp pilus assembly protein PilX
MQKMRFIVTNESGSVLVIALIILVLLTVIGIAATRTSDIELQISGNEKFHRLAFYGAESGWQVAVSWFDDQYPEITTNMGLDTSGGTINFTSVKYNNPDTVSLTDSTYTADVTFLEAQGNIPGYSSEFKRYIYGIESTGTGPGNAQSKLTVTAGKIVYVGGY